MISEFGLVVLHSGRSMGNIAWYGMVWCKNQDKVGEFELELRISFGKREFVVTFAS